MTTPTNINSGSGLTIPEEARDAAAVALSTSMSNDPDQSKWYVDHAALALEAAAPLIVATWAEQVARTYEPEDRSKVVDWYDDEQLELDGVRSMCERLRQLAAELRGVSGVSADGGEKQS